MQVLPSFFANSGIDLQIVVIQQPEKEFAPDLQRLAQWRLYDAKLLALQYGLISPTISVPPMKEKLELALQMALQPNTHLSKTSTCLQISQALLLQSPLSETKISPSLTIKQAQKQLLQNQMLLHKKGHYQGAMVYFEGEWYWGIDRLPYLSKRLQKEVRKNKRMCFEV